MKKILSMAVFVLVTALLAASPCFEELETLTLSVAASCASMPKLQLPGVEKRGANLIPDSVKFTSSDVSLYYDALTTRPQGLGLVDSALFATTQRTRIMHQIQEMLLEKGYEEGDLIVDGNIRIKSEKEVDEIKLAMGKDLSSISLSVTVDLVLHERGKTWKTKGTLEVFGDSKGTLVVQSKEFKVNDLKYQVDLKYKLSKSSG